MEVKPGYRQTEVGLLPEDWGVASLGAHFEFKNGLNKAKRYFGHGTPIINYMDVFSHPTLRSEHIHGRVQVDTRENRAYEVRQGDVFFTRTSETVDEVGIAAVLLDPIPSAVFSGFILRARQVGADFDPAFMGYCFAARYFRRQVTARASYTTRALTTGRSLSAAKLAKPPLSEQRAIAAALSDVDTLLDGLDRLIAKKRDLKRAAMQQLLAGQTRLPDSHEPWTEASLGEIADIVMGQSPSSAAYNTRGDGLPLIQGNADIAERKTIKRIFTTQITKRGRQGDILMSVRAPVGEISRATFDVCLGRGVCAIRYPNDYLYHYLIHIESGWAKHSKGSTFDSVTSKDVKAVSIRLPASLAEQAAIATVLSDMDAELAALEARRAKTRDIKQAMMQELLTGRTRLVSPQTANA